MRVLFFDIETYSALDLTKVGSYLYARHPSTDIRCLSYCLVAGSERGPIETWQPGAPAPQAFIDAAPDSETLLCAFNDAFDRQIYDQILAPRYGWPAIPLERHRCAQAAALARALPASLDAAAAALKIAAGKSPQGMATMKRLAGPRRQSAKERKAGKPLDFSATPGELATLAEYNRIDAHMTIEVVERVGLLSPAEQAIWELDQKINERGVHVDVGLLEAGLCIAEEAGRELHTRLAELTGGAVTTPKQRDRILAWLAKQGCTLSNLRKSTVADALLEPGLSEPARRLLQLRQGGAGAATTKLPTLRRWAGESGEPRIRYAYRYHGASSGRFTSLGCQLHNLRKPELEDVRGAIAAVATGSLAEMHRRGFERPLETVGQIARAAIIARPGTRLFIADLSGIEARGAAHVCGAHRELEQWRIFDASGRAEDEPYYITGISTFQQSPATARKAGKTGRLAFQYQGGVGAYRRVTGDLETSEEIIKQRRDAWRADQPEFAQFWRLAIFQAVQAIRHPGEEFSAKAVAFIFDRRTGFLEVILPSGRRLAYPAAELIEDEEYGTTSFTFLDASGSRSGRMYHERRGSGAFGGLLLENITQALCRDLFVAVMPRLEAAGYSIVMHTHDEWVCEAAEDFGSLDEFLAIVTTPPEWALDLPIAAKGRISDRLIEIVDAAKAPVVAADNAVDNALNPDDDDENEEEEEEIEKAEEIEAAPLQPEPAHLCAQCRQDPPDGLERQSAYGEAWLHSRCEEAFIRARMTEEGIAWDNPAAEQPAAATATTPAAGPSNGGGIPGPAEQPRPNGGARSDSGWTNGYPHGESAAPSAGPIAAEYVYKNALGGLHMRVVRTAGKTFPTFHWGGGEWISGWPKDVVPYRLPELLAAPADVVALVCEGEKDCDTAARYGFVATTNPGGAGKWQPDLTQYFRGKQRVCVMQDNDEAGARHTGKILNALRGVVPTVGVVTFPELGPGGDLSDYFERGGSKPYLVTRIEEALKRGTALNYTLIDLDASLPEADDWLWEGHLQPGALELITGLPGVGKSLLQCDWIAIVTTGRDWPDGTPGPQPGRVFMITAEDRVADVKRRLIAAGADLRLVHVFGDVRRNERDEQFLLAQDLDKLEHAINSKGDVQLVTIDPITAYMGSGRGFDSHRATDVRSQLLPLAKLAEKVNISFSAVTHPPKSATARTAIDSFIGSQAFVAASRIAHYCIGELGEEDDRGRRRPTGRVLFASVRGSHSAPMPTLAYHIETVRIGWDAKRGRDIIVPRIIWAQEPVDITADDAIAANRAKFEDGRKAKAAPIREFLRDILANGPVLQKVVIERGAAHGFSLNQLKYARDAIGARSFKRRGENLSSPWMWCLREHLPADAETEKE